MIPCSIPPVYATPACAAQPTGASEYIRHIKEQGRLGTHQVARRLAYGTDPAQQLDVYLPAGHNVDSPPLPVLIFFHGGAWIQGDLSWLNFMAPAVLSLPAVLVAGTYRLAPGHRWPAQYEDVRDAICHVHNQIAAFNGDPSRLLVGGHSAGGHLASMAVLKNEIPSVLGCLPVSSPCDLRYGDVPVESMEGRVYKYLFSQRDQDAQASPILLTPGNRVPFHLVWGEHDFDHIVHSNHAFVCALTETDTTVTYDIKRNAGHFDTHIMLGSVDNPWYEHVRILLNAKSDRTP
jgi:arylformamidase